QRQRQHHQDVGVVVYHQDEEGAAQVGTPGWGRRRDARDYLTWHPPAEISCARDVAAPTPAMPQPPSSRDSLTVIGPRPPPREPVCLSNPGLGACAPGPRTLPDVPQGGCGCLY